MKWAQVRWLVASQWNSTNFRLPTEWGAVKFLGRSPRAPRNSRLMAKITTLSSGVGLCASLTEERSAIPPLGPSTDTVDLLLKHMGRHDSISVLGLVDGKCLSVTSSWSYLELLEAFHVPRSSIMSHDVLTKQWHLMGLPSDCIRLLMSWSEAGFCQAGVVSYFAKAMIVIAVGRCWLSWFWSLVRAFVFWTDD